MGYVGGWAASERDAYSSLSAAKRYLGTTNPTTGQTEQVMCLFPLILNPPFTLLSAFAVAPHKWWFVSTYDLFVFSQTTSFFFGDYYYYYYYFKQNETIAPALRWGLRCLSSIIISYSGWPNYSTIFGPVGCVKLCCCGGCILMLLTWDLVVAAAVPKYSRQASTVTPPWPTPIGPTPPALLIHVWCS